MIDPASAFVDAVRTRLDRSMTDAGFPLNGVYGSDEDDPAEQVSVLYEGVVSDFLSRYPGLDPVWDEAWRRGSNGCVDLWLKWRGDNDSISVDSRALGDSKAG